MKKSSLSMMACSRSNGVWGAVALAAMSLCTPSQLRAESGSLAGFPFVIHCKLKDTYHAFYVSRLSPDGTATYVASDRIAGTISLTGEAKAIGSEGGGSCVGKTLQELRDAGQAFDLKP